MEIEILNLYPSNWLYNAGVIGFLKVIKSLGMEFNFKIDGSVEIFFDKKIGAKRVAEQWYDISKRYINIRKPFDDFDHFSNECYYVSQSRQNLIDYAQYLTEKIVLNKETKYVVNCFFCNKLVDIKLAKQYTTSFGKILATSMKSFKNSFWNTNANIYICKNCIFIVMSHHLALIKFSEQFIFINTPNFELTWDLNNLAENLISTKKSYRLRKIIGSTFVQWALKKRVLLGYWTLMNIDIITKRVFGRGKDRKEIIDHYDLPNQVVQLLMDYEIANLLNIINEDKIFNMLLQSNFEKINKGSYYAIKALLKLENEEDKNFTKNSSSWKSNAIWEYMEDSKNAYKNQDKLRKLAKFLPELYTKIRKILGGKIDG